MGTLGEKRIKRLGALTPSKRKRKRAAKKMARRRGQVRRKIAAILVVTKGPMKDKISAVQNAIRLGVLPADIVVPSVPTLRRLEAMWRAGKHSAEDYMDEHRVGRPKAEFPPEVEEAVNLSLNKGHDATETLAAGRAAAEELGLDPDVGAPSYEQVLRMARYRRANRSAGRHGSRSARIDALPKGTLPYTYAGESQTLDEMVCPVWLRQYEPRLQRNVSILADLIAIRDYVSSATVGGHLADPSKRVDEKTGMLMRSGHDAEDVLAALLTVWLPELAPPATRRFAGYIAPNLRWDNFSTHKALVERLGTATEGSLGINIPNLQFHYPPARGDIENKIKELKAQFAGTFGHVDEYIPSDIANDEQNVLRTIAAATFGRHPRLQEVDVDDLLDINEARAVVNDIFARTNATEHSSHGLSPLDLYLKHQMRHRRSGRDALTLLETRTTLVTGEGIVHKQDSKRYTFAAAEDGWIAMPDTEAVYHVDPLCRGIFIERPGGLVVFGKLKRDWAAEMGAAVMAKMQTSLSRALSDEAAQAKHAADVYALGTLAILRGEQKARETRAEAKRQKAEARRKQREADAAAAAAEATAAHGDAAPSDAGVSTAGQPRTAGPTPSPQPPGATPAEAPATTQASPAGSTDPATPASAPTHHPLGAWAIAPGGRFRRPSAITPLPDPGDLPSDVIHTKVEVDATLVAPPPTDGALQEDAQ